MLPQQACHCCGVLPVCVVCIEKLSREGLVFEYTTCFTSFSYSQQPSVAQEWQQNMLGPLFKGFWWSSVSISHLCVYV